MGLGKVLHDHSEDAEAGGTIDHPRAYDAFSAFFFAGRRRRVFRRVAMLSGARRGDRVVDVGCGTGYLTRLMSPIVGAGGHVTGVDLAPSMVEYARRRAPENCSYIMGKGQALDLPDASFDVVVSSLAVHHIHVSERGDAVREMFRVLRPGGRLLIVEFRPPTGHVASHVAGALSGPAMRQGPRELLGDLIAGAGFRVEEDGDLRPLLYFVRAVRP